MLFIGVEDFFSQVKAIPRLSREEEKALACRRADGDEQAAQRLRESGLPLVSALIRRQPPSLQSLHTVYACVRCAEVCADGFDFLQDSEAFTHRLSLHLRQCLVRCLAEQG